MTSRVIDWTRVKRVFSDALDRSPADRADFVAAACADDDSVRREVQSLLDADRESGSFIERPAADILGESVPADAGKPELERGTCLGPYEILGFLGAGGMSQVYRARDARLGRIVAIKVVAAASTDPRAEHRLLREARHASSLAHPHICTIHEVDEVGGRRFIVMEYVEGRTIRDLVCDGPLPLPAVLGLGIQVADALHHAHQRGVIHRDLKSANVVVAANGPAKVLDFGLSQRVLDPASDQTSVSAVVENATVAGTLSHMAPEVLLGRPPDPKGDIWALGVLLYEMVSGHLPFKGETSFETSNAILHSEPAPLPSRVPLALRLVIQRCLEKDPAGRYESAAEVRDALQSVQRSDRLVLTSRLLVGRHGRRVALYASILAIAVAAVLAAGRLEYGVGSIAPRIRTLAVLPLTNAALDTSQEYFSDGWTEALIGSMGNIDGVRVLSQTTVMKYRGSLKSPQEVGRELGADAVLDGSIQRQGDRLRLFARFMSTSSGQILWSNTYDRSLREAVAVNADIVRAVASSGGMRMNESARTRLSAERAVSPDVYEAYLKGRYYWNQRTESSITTAIEYFNRAIALDPSYAPPYAARADCYNQLGTLLMSSGSPQQWRPRAASSAIRALQIDPDLAEAHATLGYVHHYDWQWNEAEQEFKRAIELNPSYALAHIWYANMLGSRRRFDEAMREVWLSRDLDPSSLIVNTNVGWVLNMAGRHYEAIVQLRRTLELDSSYAQAHRRLADAYAGAGRLDDAIAEYQTVVGLNPNNPSSLGSLAEALATVGRTAEARKILADLVTVAGTRYVSPGLFADLYLRLGDRDRAFQWLDAAYRERSNYMAYLLVDASHDLYGSDPRFHDMLQRVGLE